MVRKNNYQIMSDNNSDLFEHYEFIASTGQLPLRVDKFIMNFISGVKKNKKKINKLL